ncbi:MAG: hypothetical protein JNJ83_22205 [Verrucomicrobiaceae bacterium]|nr:hypothetical protein [Verrucomicrobiaceae bacterium]
MTIHAKSSSGGSYEVTFRIENNRPTVTCTCKAGSIGQACKHKLGIVAGAHEMFDIPAQVDNVVSLLASPEWQQLVSDVMEITAQIRAIDAELERLKSDQKVLKRSLATRFNATSSNRRD